MNFIGKDDSETISKLFLWPFGSCTHNDNIYFLFVFIKRRSTSQSRYVIAINTHLRVYIASKTEYSIKMLTLYPLNERRE